MIKHPDFTAEPWCLRATGLDLDVLAQVESVFALSNGHVGWRGNLDEGEPHGLPGSYLNGVFELRPLPYAEAGFGYPESGQSVINITNGKVIRLLVDDEPFDIRTGVLKCHELFLDFRTGLLHRTVEWVSPAGSTIKLTSTRLVSFTQRSIAAVDYEVEVIGAPARVVLQSEMITNEPLPVSSADPRAAVELADALKGVEHRADGLRVALAHVTRLSRLIVAAAMDHVVTGPPGTTSRAEIAPDLARVSVSANLAPGERLRLVKMVAYAWSDSRSLPAVRDQADAALTGAMSTGWDDLLVEQQVYLDDFWDHGDVQVDGDVRIQQAVRFALFHTLQAAARAEDVAIPAKGMTGPGYDGHVFWDMESCVLEALTYLVPGAAANALRWRHSTIPAAVTRATQLGLLGATFPWRTIHGEECSGYWPAGVAAFHINADIANAVLRYVRAAGDAPFEESVGVDVLVQTARLWASLGYFDGTGGFRIDGVTGPDEYSAVADNNVYTNLMAQRNLASAAATIRRYPARAYDLHVTDKETAAWLRAAETMFIPYDRALGVHPQSEGFTHHETWDFENTAADEYPLLLHFPYFDLYRKQVVKQADLVLAMHVRSDAFTAEQKARNFAYYDALTVRDSSLSSSAQAVIAAEVGHLDLAHDYVTESAFLDLNDTEHNTRDGLHIASLAGIWSALVAGYGGMRHDETGLRFRPRLPSALSRISFGMRLAAGTLWVEIDHTEATYALTSGAPLPLQHFDTAFLLTSGSPQTHQIPHADPAGDRPVQPAGRAPEHDVDGEQSNP
ncbi:glycosyl hydrolase (plasmid) [Frondihabitans sp. PAMC 28766]|uniref:glycoside hydrolase family 65 protein n=1 Tax=Frondihabitans sp. PAMC 28766 TaxID=1795630 RepID=UPI00078CFF4E|nr:glycosyl hydrolase family 65 protein [Frondihabitans sp. PAMC 28766]AMM22680.1 glycosyl hydrolase [Frondihabitans sp. PAMC 28766]